MQKKLLSIFVMLAVLLAVFSYDYPSKLPCDVVLFNFPQVSPEQAQRETAISPSERLPAEYMQYLAVPESSMVKQIDKNTVLVFEQVTEGNGREVSAYMREQVLYIDVRKFSVFTDWTGEIFYAVITIPDGVTVETIDTRYRTVFQTIFPKKTFK